MSIISGCFLLLDLLEVKCVSQLLARLSVVGIGFIRWTVSVLYQNFVPAHRVSLAMHIAEDL